MPAYHTDWHKKLATVEAFATARWGVDTGFSTGYELFN
jgi:hypothetical protein